LPVPALAFLFLAGPVRAEAPPSPDSAQGILSFGETLLKAGESYRAVTEFLRVLHHYPDEKGASARALDGLGRAYASAGRWDEAAEAFGRLAALDPANPSAPLSRGAALYRAGRHEEARAALSGRDGEAASTLATLSWLREGGEGEPPAGIDTALVGEHETLPRKSPATAGILSAVIPGAGHLYVDRPRDALTALLINGLFTWGAVRSAREDQWGLAGVLGAVELFWYSGTIVGAVNGAHKWNAREEERFYRTHEAGAVPRWSLWTNGTGMGAAFSLHW
jgi:hypothetical protein